MKSTPRVRWKSWIALCATAVIATVFAPAVSAMVGEHLPGESPPGFAIAGTSGGEVYGFGEAVYSGSAAEDPDDFEVVDIASTPSGAGYWMVTAAGEVRPFGDAVFRGDMSMIALDGPVVAMAVTPDGNGYWLTSADGGVFTFGTASFEGAVSHLALAAPIVSMAPTASGLGYWLVAEDGGIFALGDAAFHGSAGDIDLNQPIVDLVASEDGNGYWMVAKDGGIFSYGDVEFHGSLGDYNLDGEEIVGADGATGGGYWLAGDRGSVFAFGAAEYHGGALAGPEEPIEAIAARPQGDGYWLASAPGISWDGPPVPDGSGEGRRIVYSNSEQRVWLIEEDGSLFDSYLVSGRLNTPSPGDYSVFSKSRHAFAGHDGITMEWMVRFAHGRTLAIGFHGIPKYSNGVPMQTEEQLGTYRSGGCVRQRLDKAEQLYNWAPVGTAVIVLA